MGNDGQNYSKIRLDCILELCYLWCVKQQRCDIVEFMRISEKTVSYWFSMFRNVCHQVFATRDKMGSHPNRIIEIDESQIRGKRKNNRGRYLGYDVWRTDPNASFVLPSDYSSDSNSESTNNQQRERYFNRIDGPWVVGIVECEVSENKRTLVESRYFYVPKRDKETLIPLIKNEVAQGAIIYTDEWASYRTLSQCGYIHRTVNHSERYVAFDGSHTNTVEVTWHHLKTKILRRMSGVPKEYLESYLIEHSVRSKFKNRFDFFHEFLNFIKTFNMNS